ncbi:MAG: hypothetical protein ACK419_04220 [Pyrinomonadaceae bacterium]
MRASFIILILSLLFVSFITFPEGVLSFPIFFIFSLPLAFLTIRLSNDKSDEEFLWKIYFLALSARSVGSRM